MKKMRYKFIMNAKVKYHNICLLTNLITKCLKDAEIEAQSRKQIKKLKQKQLGRFFRSFLFKILIKTATIHRLQSIIYAWLNEENNTAARDYLLPLHEKLSC